jgi:hypothetical protein
MSFYFHEAGSLLSEDGQQQLLIARWGPYALLADGKPVKIGRIQEWPESPFGEWIVYSKANPPTAEDARDFLSGMEAALLLDNNSLDMETVWTACLAFASAASVHGLYLREVLQLHE